MFIHKSDWDRITRQEKEGPADNNKKRAQLAALHDLSQSWIKSWPDTVQGHVLQVEDEHDAKRAKQIQLVKEYKMKKELKRIRKLINSNAACLRAKDLIFDDSSYGRQLLSALLESKTIEERHAQIEFQKKLKIKKGNEMKKTDDYPCIIGDSLYSGAPIKNNKIQEIAKFNEAMYETKRREEQLKREKLKESELEDIQMIQKFAAQEDKQNTKPCISQQEINDFMKQREEIIKLREMEEKEIDYKIELWRKYENAKKFVETEVLKKIQKEKHNSSQENYKLVAKLQNERNQRYEDFLQKGIDRIINIEREKEAITHENENIERKKRCLIDEENRKLAAAKRGGARYVSHRQCILAGSRTRAKQVIKEDDCTQSSGNLRKKTSKGQPSEASWSGLGDAHAHFARRADRTLRECAYKECVQKVIKKYEHDNGLQLDKFLPPIKGNIG